MKSRLALSRSQGSPDAAFTRVELLALVVTTLTIILVCVPLLADSSSQSDQIGCLNNLRQIGIAFQSWGTDHQDNKPWSVIRDRIDVGGDGTPSSEVALQFSFLSNHLSSPSILIDPAETADKRIATRWDNSPNGGFLNPIYQENALSYMLGLHTTLPESDEILAGDRNGFFMFSGCVYGYVGTRAFESYPQFRGWINGPHGPAGNLLLNDGRVEYASQQRLKAVVALKFVSPHFLVPSD